MHLSKNVETSPNKHQYTVIDSPDDIAYTPKKRNNPIILYLKKLYYIFSKQINSEAELGNFFLFLPVFSGAGAIWYFNLSFEPSLLYLFVLLVLGGLFVILFRHSYVFHLITFTLVVFIIGAIAGKMETLRLNTHIIANSVTTTLTGRILTLEQHIRGEYKLIIEVLDSERPALAFNPKKIKLNARSLPDNIHIGDGIKGLVRLRPPSGPSRLGSYDFSFHNFYNGISAQGFFMGKPQLVIIPPSTSMTQRLLMTIATLRMAMTERIANAIPGEAGAIAAALITGQRGGINEATNDALRIAGLSHILSISGLHMAMVTGMVLVIARLILSCFPLIAMRYPAKKIAAIIALFVASFYLILSGSDVAAQRSYVMVAVMMIAIVFNRSALTMRNLAIAALITVAITPHEILGPSFQMSFGATASLIAIFGWWSTRKKQQDAPAIKKNHKQPGLFYKYIFVPTTSTAIASLVAGFASGIYAAYHFNNTAPLGILGNGLAFPMMSILVMPFALLAAISMPLHLEWLPLQIMGFGVEIVKKIAFWVASISPNFNTNIIDEYDLIYLSIGLILLFFLQTSLRLCGLFFLIFGIIMTFITPMPSALIAEDGRLVGVYTEDNKLAINLQRPPSYTLSNWLASLRLKNSDVIAVNSQNNNGFYCSDFLCSIKIMPNQNMKIIENPNFIKDHCLNADIIFLSYTHPNDTQLQNVKCKKNALIITKKDLALYGMGEIYFINGQLKIKWASSLPQRPWNQYRNFVKNTVGIND